MTDFPICNWTIAIANSSVNTIAILQVRGSKEMVKENLMDLVIADRDLYVKTKLDTPGIHCHDERLIQSAIKVDEITENNEMLNTYIAFPDYSIRYTAVKYEQPIMLRKRKVP